MTLQEIIDANPDKVNYLIQNEGNINPISRYLVNSWDEDSVIIQQIDTNTFFTIPKTTVGYEVYTPPLSDPLSPYKDIVRGAMDFFSELMVNFAAENITQGITVYGKTKEVADYLQDVMRYGQSGSLYEVIHEIDTLVAAGIPAELSPFVTVAKLNNFKQEITTHLGS